MSKNKTTRPKHVLDNRSNQLNPQHPEYYRSRGIDPPLAECLAARRQNTRLLPDESRRQSQKTLTTK